jgi:anti-anti-sigma factor
LPQELEPRVPLVRGEPEARPVIRGFGATGWQPDHESWTRFVLYHTGAATRPGGPSTERTSRPDDRRHMMNLSLDVHGHDDVATLAVAGEVDRHCAGRLLERSLGAVREHGPWLTIDLAGVTFMDCGGVEVLLTIRCRSHLMGGRL